jgi:hypothetical protein
MGLTPRATASALPRPRTLQRPPVRKAPACEFSLASTHLCSTHQVLPRSRNARSHRRAARPADGAAAALHQRCCTTVCRRARSQAARQAARLLPPANQGPDRQRRRGVHASGDCQCYRRSPAHTPLQRRKRRRRTARKRSCGRPPRACGSPTSCPRPPTTLRSRLAPARRAAAPLPALLAAAALLPAMLTRSLTRPRAPAARGCRQRRGVQGRRCAAAAGALGRHGRRVRPCGGRRGGRGRGRPAGGRQRGLQGGPWRRSRRVCGAAVRAGRPAARRRGASGGAAVDGARRWRVPCRGPRVRPTAHLHAWGAQQAGRPCRAAPGPAGGSHAHAGQAAQCLHQCRARTWPGAGGREVPAVEACTAWQAP